MATAGQARVPELVEEAVVAEEVGGVAGHALGLVDGEGVAVGEMAGVDVGVGDVDVAAAVEADLEAAAVGAGDGASAAVEEVEVVPVAVGDDAVADGEVGGVVAPDRLAELPCGSEVMAGAVVEVGDVAAVGGDHHRVEPVASGGVPVGDEGGADVVGVVAEGDAAGAVEVVDGPVGVVEAKGEQCGAFVAVVLAAVLW